jgi:hypothetical protein
MPTQIPVRTRPPSPLAVAIAALTFSLLAAAIDGAIIYAIVRAYA